MLTRPSRRSILLTLLSALCLATAVGATLATGQERQPVASERASAPLAPGDEIVSARTRSSRTYAAGHGALRSVLYADDVSFKDAAGDWHAIDNTLVPSGSPGYAYGNRANSWSLDLPRRLEDAPVRVRDGARWVSFALDGGAGDVRTSKNEATYGDALPGVDVAYAAHGGEVKETLTLADTRAATSYRFAVDTSADLTPRMADGGIEFVDADGDRAFSFAPPFMTDAAGKTSRDVRFDLVRSGDGWTVELVADRGWIAASERKFPVVVDPTTLIHGSMNLNYGGADHDCGIANGTDANLSTCGAASYGVGYDGTKIRRAMFEFDYMHDNVPQGSLILSARIGLYVDSASTGTSADWAIQRMSRAWTGASWNKYDGTNGWTSAGGDFDSTPVATKQIGATTGWHYWPVREFVQNLAANGRSKDHGFLVKQVGETTNNKLTIHGTDGSPLMPKLEIVHAARGGSQQQYTFQSERLTDRSGYGVNVANGNLLITNQDVSIPGTGPALDITRAYNSLTAAWEGFGVMSMNTGADVQLEELSTGDVVFWGPNGQVSLFVKNGTTYDQPTGLDAKLEKDQPTTGQWRLTYLRPQSKLIFNSSMKLIRQEDRNGNDIQFTYDTEGYLQKITDTQDRDTTFTVAGTDGKMVTTITDPAARVHTYTYPNGYLDTYTDPDGGVTTYSWQTSQKTDRLTQIIDPVGNKTTFTYETNCLEYLNPPCRVKTIRRYKDATNYDETSFAYNEGAGTGDTCKKSTDTSPDGNIVGHTIVTDARGYTTTYCWDKELRVVFTKDQEGNSRAQHWTTNSNVDKYTLGSGAQAETGYDNNRVKSISAPGATTSTTTTPPNDNRANQTFDYTGRASDNFFPSSTTDPEGRTHNFSYTSNSNLTQVQESGSATPQVNINYNDGGTGESNDGTVAWSEDGSGNRTTYGYDAKGNLTSIDPPGSSQGTVQIGYDTTISRISSITDGKQQRREFTYDPIDRVKQVKFYDASNTLVRTDTYSYDKNGNRLTRTDASGSYTYVYDALNRLKEESRPGHTTTFYGYDGMSNLTSLTAAGEQTLFTYWPDNIVKEVKEPPVNGVSPTTLFNYNTDNSRTKTTFPSGTGVVEDITYDRAERPTQIQAKKGTTVLTNFTYDYKRSSEAKERMLKQKVDDVRLNRSTRYRYDELSRVKQAATSGSTSFTWDYDYDNASNRTKKTKGAATTSYRYNVANELCWRVSGTTTGACSDPSPPAGAVTYAYDANGDVTGSSGGLSATYNVAKQSTAFKKDSTGANTTFEYAGQGQTERTKKNSTLYLDSVLGVSAEKATNYRGYVRDNKGALVGMRNPEGSPVVMKRYYYLRDALGSVVAVVNEQGTVVRRHVYEDPYGEVVSNDTIVTGAPSNPYRFAGEYFDSETDLYKMGERYYDPALARWTQKDPMMQAFSPREANGYAYVGGDPVNRTDPSGMWGSFLSRLGGAIDDAWDSTAGVRTDLGSSEFVSALPTVGCAIGGLTIAAGTGGVGAGVAAFGSATCTALVAPSPAN